MNAVSHAQISARRWGGRLEDYLPIHEFMDSTKELCSDNRHRILHTLWGIRRVIQPIFGHTIVNSDGRHVNVKDLCEKDHILPDYQMRFIPTLSDFVLAMDAHVAASHDFAAFAGEYADDPQLMELLLSPLSNTGSKASLLITHNSWFVNEVVPRIFSRTIAIKDFGISPHHLFGAMQFERWMDNGNAYPPSVKNLMGKVVG